MRTKTLALSTLLGMLGSASLMAQSTNVYSLNAVGYINATMPPGFSMVTCPLICSPDNTIATLFNNSTGAYQQNGNAQIYAFTGGTYSSSDTAAYLVAPPNSGGWGAGGTITVNPGQAIFFYNTGNTTLSATFVGTVPQNGTTAASVGYTAANTATGLTNTLIAGFNMVGSIVPASGDLVISNQTVINGITYSNNITTNYFGNVNGPPFGPNPGDFVFTYDPVAAFSPQITYAPLAAGGWAGGPGTAGPGGGDPVTTNVSQGFFYYNGSGAPETWVENFVINP